MPDVNGDLRKVQGQLEDDVWERVKFIKGELREKGKTGNLNNVLRYLMIESGWMSPRVFPYEL